VDHPPAAVAGDVDIEAGHWFLSDEAVGVFTHEHEIGKAPVQRFVRSWIRQVMDSPRHSLSRKPSTSIDWHKLREEVQATTTWLGAVAGVVYTALYARFSAQWSYLANVYHQIKSAIITGPNHPSEEQREQLTYWKAAFVEDAQDLHGAHPPTCVGVPHERNR
jgi:hypothetical protein